MRAYLDEELFESDAVDPLCIVEIIAQAKEGRHQVLLRPSFAEDDDRSLPRNRWLRDQSEPLRRRLAALLRQSASEAGWKDPNRPHITAVAGDESNWITGRLAAPQALRLLQAPLQLLVENSRNDWAFLLAIVGEAHRQSLRDARGKGWIEVKNGGGLGELKAQLKAMLSVGAKDTPRHIERLRTWVIFDRDADVEDPRRASRTSEEVASLCREHGLQYLQLSRRTIENYLPIEVVEAQAPRQHRSARVSALAKLRDHHSSVAFAYNMKEGFIKDAHALPKEKRNRRSKRWEAAESAEDRQAEVPSDELPILWQELPIDVLADLLFGFGGRIAHSFELCDTEPLWEEWCRREYDRGPTGQPSRGEIATQILELI